MYPPNTAKKPYVFHQTKDPIFNSQFPWKRENIGSKPTHPSVNSTSDLIPKRSDLEETWYRKSKCILKTITGQKNYRTREGKPISKTKKIKLVEFYLQIKPPRNKKKTQVVKCRQEKHTAIGGDGRRKGKKREEEQQQQQYKAINPNSPKGPSLGRYGISKFWNFLQTIKYKEHMGVKNGLFLLLSTLEWSSPCPLCWVICQ
jgi:hypothetical protein